MPTYKELAIEATEQLAPQPARAQSYHNCREYKTIKLRLPTPDTWPYTVHYVDAYYHQSDYLYLLTTGRVPDPGVEVNVSRKLSSNPERLDLRVV